MGSGGKPVSRRRAVFLDRDGVLNEPSVRNGRSYAPRRIEDFKIYDEAPQAISRIRNLGFLTVLVTNQKDIGAGLMAEEQLAKMHAELTRHITLDAIKICTCVDECPCYKPNPGMLTEAADELGVDLAHSIIIGDRWRDVGAGKRAGCTTIFIDRGYDELLRDKPDFTVRDVSEAADLIQHTLT